MIHRRDRQIIFFVALLFETMQLPLTRSYLDVLVISALVMAGGRGFFPLVNKRRPVSLDESTLRPVVEGTASETGSDFFKALVRNLATALGTAGAWVTEYFPKEQKLRALAMWLNAEYVEHYEYCLEGTPCAPVVENRGRPVCFDGGVVRLTGSCLADHLEFRRISRLTHRATTTAFVWV